MDINILAGRTQVTSVKENLLYYKVLKRFPNNRRLNQIKKVAITYDLPHEILLGIYMIEVTFRPFWFRVIESLALIFRILLWFVFAFPIPNYTVGKFQIGLGVVSKYNGQDIDNHSRLIQPQGPNQIYSFYSSQFWRKNIDIAAWWLSKMYSDNNNLEYYRRVRYMGIKYNGSIPYGLLLERIVKSINNKV